MDPNAHERFFLTHYQTQLFRERNADPFEVASIRRKCFAQMIRASNSTCDSETLCELLRKKVKDYSDIVDDKSGVNNYGEAIEALMACSQTECKQWKSSLEDTVDTELSIGDSEECKNHEVTPQHIQFLLTAHKAEEEKKISDKSCFVDDKSVNSGFLGSARHQMANEGKHPFFNQNLVGTCVNKAEDVTCSGKSTSSSDQKMQNGGLKNFSWNSSVLVPKPQPAVFPLESSTGGRFGPVALHAGVKRNQAALQLPQQQQTTSVAQPGSFSTAREELKLQNLKKFGARSSAALEYGGQKKSLGNTRRGVMNKFVPPVRNQGDEGGCGMMNRPDDSKGWREEDVEDERLRNIDPKMIDLIRSEIMDCGAPVHWDDIAGLQFAKNTIQEIVVWPMLRPEIFTGLRRPPKGILLFGPPGTGKTLIGKCIASQSRSTFFSISASSLTSKWIGDGEKMVRALFAVARVHQPAVVFIDEIDSLLSQRSDTEHESSRRIKTEFLVQLDGATTGEEDRILVIGATNRPQELDEAARRRLVKRLYIPLPDHQARCQIVERLMVKERHCLTREQIEEIGKLTDGYSGADMKNVCQEASLGPIRSMSIMDIQNISPDEVRPIAFEDFQSALRRVRSSVSSADLDTYVKWDKLFGSG